jgi:uncharacterized protein (TIGR02246 family)
MASPEELDDIEAIKQLKARYFRTLDRQEWDGFAQVFARDAVLEVPEAGIVRQGRDEIVGSVSKALAGATTVHHGHMPEIELTGPDTATGIWAMADYVEWPSAETGERVASRATATTRRSTSARTGPGASPRPTCPACAWIPWWAPAAPSVRPGPSASTGPA